MTATTTEPTGASAVPPPIPDPAQRRHLDCDVLVIGGGTAGTMAALSAAEAGARVLLLEKAHVRHSGALAMGMDGVNNAVIPGQATPEEYVADITRANDGIVNQRTVMQTATRGFAMVKRLERYGVKFEKDERGEYAVRRVHRSGSYVLPMPEGRDVKKVLYRVLRERRMRERVRIENRLMPVRVLTSGGRAVGAVGFHTRTGEFTTIAAGAVVLATGACGRLGLPASGYLYGTYENPTNAGDGYAMAYHAGAELSGIECFQINPLIKDYNGPACAYVANPFGGYQVNNQGERFVDCDYWSGQMMSEVVREIESARGPIYLKLSHLPDETVTKLEGILHHTERPTRGTFHAGRGHDYRTHDVEMHVSEIGLCSGHSASGVWVDEHGATTVPGLYAAGDLACVPHNYMLGAFVFGDLAGTHAAGTATGHGDPRDAESLPEDQIRAAHELVYRPWRQPDGPPQPQVEYKLRRFVNDYVAPPKTGRKLTIALETFDRMGDEVAAMGARTVHELMRCAEVTFILDCARMAAASSLVRTESRWGLYHERADTPGRDDAAWLAHLNLRRDAQGRMEFLRRPVASYVVPVEGFHPQEDRPVEALGHLVMPDHLHAAAADATLSAAITDAVSTTDAMSTDVASALPRAVDAPSESAAHAASGSAAGRILRLLAVTEELADADGLAEYLADPAPEVRRAAVDALTEAVPAGTGPALAAALGDGDATVRAAAAAGLVELVEVLVSAPDVDALRGPLRGVAVDGADAVVRAAAVTVLRALRLLDAATAGRALRDRDAEVRLAAVAGLVGLGLAGPLVAAADDPARQVRVAVAQALGTLAEGAEALAGLAGDADVHVRAAALEAAAALGTPPRLGALALAGADDPAWQVRAAAATALGAVAGPGAGADVVSVLLRGAADGHADVRKAAVTGLLRHAGRPEVAAALTAALADGDADVRAVARSAFEVTGAEREATTSA